VFGCIASASSYYIQCPYYYSASACDFGIAAGVISFIGLMVFLVADALFDNISNIQHRKYIVIADAVFSCKVTLRITYMLLNKSYVNPGDKKTKSLEL